MSNRSIKKYLFFTILILSLLPMGASYLFLEDVLEGALNIGLNEKVDRILEKSQQDLKILRHKDQANEKKYKNRFYEIQEMRAIYYNPEYTKDKLKKAYISYYSLGFVAVLLLSLSAALVLSRKIASSYQRLTETLIRKNERLHQLENIDEFQEIAGKLAHEIKNPLTPIEIMVSSLSKAYGKKNSEAFEIQLKDTQIIVKEEIKKLKEMVHNFSSFSKLPSSSLHSIYFPDFLDYFIKHYGKSWPRIKLDTDYTHLSEECVSRLHISLDKSLFTQVLINIINNAAEANQDTDLAVVFSISVTENEFHLEIVNNGQPIPESSRTKLFKMYYSTKHREDNMGLGLSIVKKIVFEHNGDIMCLPLTEGAGFCITLPFTEKSSHSDVR